MMISEEGLSANAINRAIDRKAKHGTLFQKEDTQADIWPYSEAKRTSFQLLKKDVVADLTATDTTEYLIEAMHQDFHVVLANKKTIGGTQKNFDHLLTTARTKGLACDMKRSGRWSANHRHPDKVDGFR